MIPSLLIVTPGFLGEMGQNVVSFFPPSTPFVMVARSASLPDWPLYIGIVGVMLVSIFVARAIAIRTFALGIVGEVRITRLNRSKQLGKISTRSA